jgi:hypothetical protein
VTQLVKHAIESHPLVLILEDMHWADELSIRLLSFLARRIAEWPVLLVITAREEEVDARSALRRTLNELRLAGVPAGPGEAARALAEVEDEHLTTEGHNKVSAELGRGGPTEGPGRRPPFRDTFRARRHIRARIRLSATVAFHGRCRDIGDY